MKEQVEQLKAQLRAEIGNLKAKRSATAEQLDALDDAIQQQLGAILACEHLLSQVQPATAGETTGETTDAQN